jgi:hypothetical protein
MQSKGNDVSESVRTMSETITKVGQSGYFMYGKWTVYRFRTACHLHMGIVAILWD